MGYEPEKFDFATKREIIAQMSENVNKDCVVNDQVVYMLWKLDKIREEKNISYLTVSAESGVSVPYVHSLLHGHRSNVSLSVLIKLCKVMGIGIADLLPENAFETKDIKSGDLFEEITREMTPEEKNALLEVVRNCKCIMNMEEKK